jgi:NAD+ diphosphatase
VSAAGPSELSGLSELGNLALSRVGVDRATARRGDDEWLTAAWADPGTRVLVVDSGQALVRPADDAMDLVFVPPGEAPRGVRFLLGIDPEGVVYFGVAAPLPAGAGRDAGAPGAARPASLREAGPLLSDRDAGLMTHAVALANWHAVFVHCPRCGTVTRPEQAGYSRRCPNDGSEHFPKVDPAMIVLVTDSADRALLARNAQWPARRVSILAGFVEAGESSEQAVMREVREETGLSVGAIRYLGSQPWPMPQSLMLGFRAEAEDGQQITVDTEEIAEAGWYSREELRAAIGSGQIRLPPPVSIAHRIIQSWYGAELPGSW